MGSFIRHTTCPRCKSRDNLGEYTDGWWCFGCHAKFPKIQFSQQNPTNEKPPRFSDHYSETIPEEYRKYLEKYELTKDEISRFLWSETYQRLSYPIYRESSRVAEYLRSNTKQPKALYIGEKVLHFIGEGFPTVLVEDILSAIKVGRYAKCSPVWGSALKKDLRIQLKNEKHVVFWLDSDMYKEAIKQASILRSLGIPSSVIYTEQDPKELTSSQIQKQLRAKEFITIS